MQWLITQVAPNHLIKLRLKNRQFFRLSHCAVLRVPRGSWQYCVCISDEHMWWPDTFDDFIVYMSNLPIRIISSNLIKMKYLFRRFYALININALAHIQCNSTARDTLFLLGFVKLLFLRHVYHSGPHVSHKTSSIFTGSLILFEVFLIVSSRKTSVKVDDPWRFWYVDSKGFCLINKLSKIFIFEKKNL